MHLIILQGSLKVGVFDSIAAGFNLMVAESDLSVCAFDSGVFDSVAAAFDDCYI